MVEHYLVKNPTWLENDEIKMKFKRKFWPGGEEASGRELRGLARRSRGRLLQPGPGDGNL